MHACQYSTFGKNIFGNLLRVAQVGSGRFFWIAISFSIL